MLQVSSSMQSQSNRFWRRCAIALTLVGLILLIWLSLGVGIIGGDGDRANAMYFAVVLVAAVGAAIVRLRSAGMARVLVAMAVVQGLITTTAVFAGLGRPWSGPAELVLLNGFFIGLYLTAAWLFRRAS
jgi:hypothetical protein